jgi:hypothetical protein
VDDDRVVEVLLGIRLPGRSLTPPDDVAARALEARALLTAMRLAGTVTQETFAIAALRLDDDRDGNFSGMVITILGDEMNR